MVSILNLKSKIIIFLPFFCIMLYSKEFIFSCLWQMDIISYNSGDGESHDLHGAVLTVALVTVRYIAIIFFIASYEVSQS